MSTLELYNNVSQECSKLFTERYSTSFSSGIRLFHPSLRNPIYSIYGFVRVADEIVDTFHSYQKEELFRHFRNNLEFDFKNGISTNPIINSFIHVCIKYDIPYTYVDAFMDSMEIDLYQKTFTRDLYDQYIYGSAEVIGLMCLKVFCYQDSDLFDRLKFSAQKLGSAFQKINFLRDIKSDLDDRGRVYFPNLDWTNFDLDTKHQIEEEIRNEFDEGLEGIKGLPVTAKLGVYVAFKYYKKLLREITMCKPEEIQRKRIRVGDFEKFVILSSSFIRSKVNLI